MAHWGDESMIRDELKPASCSVSTPTLPLSVRSRVGILGSAACSHTRSRRLRRRVCRFRIWTGVKLQLWWAVSVASSWKGGRNDWRELDLLVFGSERPHD